MSASTSEQPTDTDDGVQNNYYKIHNEVAVSLEKNCILHMCGQKSKQTVALGLSDYSLALYDVNTLTNIQNFSAHKNRITDIKFGSVSENLIYSSSLDGILKAHDLRCNRLAFELKDDTVGLAKPKPITSFDFCCGEVYGAAGTEVFDGDAFIIFFDVRRQRLLGGYWETHTDDITQVRFHPRLKNIIATGSTDGIINVFNISERTETDALTSCLNTESSVDNLFWIEGRNFKFQLSCITHTEEYQLWECDGVAPFAHFSREDIANYLKDHTLRNTYIVNNPTQTEDDLLLMTGCFLKKRKSLQVLYLNKDDMSKVHTISHLKGNQQRVRSSLYYKEDEFLLTGGENGILNLWKPCSKEELESDSSKLKCEGKRKKKEKSKLNINCKKKKKQMSL